MKRRLDAAVALAHALAACGGVSVSMGPTTKLQEGKTKTLNAEITATCGFNRVHARYKRSTDVTWLDSGVPRQAGSLFSSDVPGSQTFTAGERYDFRWAVDYDHNVRSILDSTCQPVSPSTATADSSFTVLGCLPAPSAALPVELLPQQTTQWCWAASAQMVMRFLGTDVAQCTQANERLGRTDCCGAGGGICGLSALTYPIVRGACIQPDWPERSIQNHGFTFRTTANNTALTWRELTRELSDADSCGRAPVIFSWEWTGGGAHAMVAKGYHTLVLPMTDVPDVVVHYVHVDNPWLPCFGDDEIITYEEYVARAGDHAHGYDTFEIRH